MDDTGWHERELHTGRQLRLRVASQAHTILLSSFLRQQHKAPMKFIPGASLTQIPTMREHACLVLALICRSWRRRLLKRSHASGLILRKITL